jgi:hypothetical protein
MMPTSSPRFVAPWRERSRLSLESARTWSVLSAMEVMLTVISCTAAAVAETAAFCSCELPVIWP